MAWRQPGSNTANREQIGRVLGKFTRGGGRRATASPRQPQKCGEECLATVFPWRERRWFGRVLALCGWP